RRREVLWWEWQLVRRGEVVGWWLFQRGEQVLWRRWEVLRGRRQRGNHLRQQRWTDQRRELLERVAVLGVLEPPGQRRDPRRRLSSHVSARRRVRAGAERGTHRLLRRHDPGPARACGSGSAGGSRS